MSEWISVPFSIIMNSFSVLDILLIIKLFFGVDIPQRYYWRIGVVFGGFHLLMLLLFHKFQWVMFGLVLIYIVLVEFYFIKERRWRILLFTIAALCTYSQYEMLVSAILEYTGILQYDVSFGEFPLFSMLETIVIFVILAVLVSILERKHPLVPVSTGGMLLLFVFSVLSPAFLSILSAVEENLQNNEFTLVCICFMLVLNAAVLYGIVYHNASGFYKKLSKNYKQQFDSEYEFFKGYKEEQQEVIRFRHDWKNHMLLLQSMLEEKEYEKAQQYFASLSEKSGKGSYQALSGNEIVDMILGIKMERMEQSGISVSCDGSLASLGFMEPMDCCILFSNLIDNAIEANESYTGTRYISIHGVQHPGTLLLVVENPTGREVRWEGEQLISTKEAGEAHGIGSQNVLEIIHKYAGECSVTTEEHLFFIKILFSIEPA
ncbi:MAG: GHKL domain-containing protein [Bacteroides sp.]|nr:GHKL domain-containing protein [Bacteroides sp.]MCM1550513.1 GHKL domain-containing protein [Clostridium sp.]